MKWFASTLLLVGLASLSSAVFLAPGKEYTYALASTVSAGSDDYVSFASVFNISAIARVQKQSTSLITVQLSDLKYGSYNGEFSYFPQPVYEAKAYQELNPLTEPFHINLNAQNLAESVVLSQNIPEWARNIHRGLASVLQLDFKKEEGNSNYEVKEKTVNGECPTTYQLTKGDNGQQEIRKYRSVLDCENRVIGIRQPGRTAQYCPDDNTRNVFNSTGWAVFKAGVRSGEPVMESIMAGGGITYSIFGPKGHTQYSFSMSTFTLQEVKASGFKKIPAPSNSKTYDNLRFVFEYEFDQEQDLTTPGPFFFHYKAAATDDATVNDIVSKVKEYVKELVDSLDSTAVFDDLIKFHTSSPFKLLPLIASLNYNQLKSLHKTFVDANTDAVKKLELNFFLDSLVLTGTGPAALLVRDVIATSTDTRQVGRLVSQVPYLMRNPTEKLLKEYEGLLSKADATKHQGRFISFAFASLVGRVCKLDRCKQGTDKKYIQQFSDQYDKADNFEDKTYAVLLLSNIGLKDAIAKLKTIVQDTTADRTIRVAAMTGLKNMAKFYDVDAYREILLPIFYDAANHPELRNTAAAQYLSHAFDEKNAQMMATSMWFERCEQVKHYLFTFLKSLSTTVRPCLKTQGAQAAAVLMYFPPMEVDRTKSGHYIRGYYDRDYNFGSMTQISVQKSGESAFPSSLYLGFNGMMAGYGSNFMSVFIRIEGVGKAIADRIMSMTTGVIDFDDIKTVFEKIGVEERTAGPLKIELAMKVHHNIIAYHAADQKSVTTIPMWLKKIQEMKSTYDLNLARMFLVGGIIIEEPTTFGTPVSVITSATGMVGAKIKVNREKKENAISSASDMRFQAHFFLYSTINNHLPAFGTINSVSAVRTYRARAPRHVTVGVDMKQQSLTFSATTPTEDDPFIVQVHAAAYTQVKSDLGALKDASAVALLKASCPDCSKTALISKGKAFRGSRDIGLPKLTRFNYLEGIKRGAEFFDCERPHSKYHTLKKVAKYFNEDSKNTGGLAFWRVMLGLQHLRDSIFLSPTTETCGLKNVFIQDKSAKSILEKIEGQVRLVSYSPDPNGKLGLKVQVKSTLNFKYGGPEPNTRTLDILAGVQTTGINDKKDIKLRFLAKDEKTKKNGVLCVDINAQNKKADDFLSFQGPNEPSYERNIKITWGPEPEGKNACPTTAAYIKANRKARRSQEQVEESQGNSWPYKQCKEQTNSKAWPGTTTPSSHECMQAAIDQTNLRESNITIDYKIDIESRNRWRKPAVVLAAFMLPYWEEGSSSSAAHLHAHHVETKSDPDYAEGKLEIDVSASKTTPMLDIHWHGSQGQEEHFHKVDLQALPGFLRPKPVFSRFSPYYYNLFQAGIFGYCVQGPSSVITYDNYTYSLEDLTDCPTLLTADCDDKPRFAVLTRKLSADKIGVTVILGDHKIELTDLNNAKVDGKSIPLTDSIYTDPEDEKLYKFMKFNPTYVAVLAEKLSLYVGYTGNYVTVTAGSRYKATACGLCGNFDGSKSNDLVGPKATCKLNASDMAKAYVVAEGKCTKSSPACVAE